MPRSNTGPTRVTETQIAAANDLLAQTIAARTTDAYMRDEYGEDRWLMDIRELIRAGYTVEAIEWIVRSKIARWANDYNESMLTYIVHYVGDAKLRTWMRG